MNPNLPSNGFATYRREPPALELIFLVICKLGYHSTFRDVAFGRISIRNEPRVRVDTVTTARKYN